MSEAKAAPFATQNGTNVGYKVEARVKDVGGAVPLTPVTFGAQTFDAAWRTVDFKRGSPGVPGEHPIIAPLNMNYGLFTREQAEVLRWWFLADANLSARAWCLETRLRRYRVKYQSECHEEESVAFVDANIDRGFK